MIKFIQIKQKISALNLSEKIACITLLIGISALTWDIYSGSKQAIVYIPPEQGPTPSLIEKLHTKLLKIEQDLKLARKQAQVDEIQALQQKRDKLQKQIEDRKFSYEIQREELKRQIEQSDKQSGEFSHDVLTAAKKALDQGNDKKALKLFKQSSLAHQTRLAEIEYQMGVIHIRNIDYQQAKQHFEKSAKLMPKHTRYLDAAGFINATLANYANSIKYYKQSLALKMNQKNQMQIALNYHDLGLELIALGKYQAAITNLQQALSIYKQDKNQSIIATLYTDIGECHYRQSNYEHAIANYETALDILKNDDKQLSLAMGYVYSQLANVWIDKADYEFSLDYYQKALKIYQAKLHPNDPEIAIGYHNIAIALFHTNKFQQANAYNKKAQSIFISKLTANHPHVAHTYRLSGDIEFASSNYVEAIANYEKALAIQLAKLEKNHPDTAETHNSIAKYAIAKKDFNKAKTHLEKARAIVQNKFNKKAHALTAKIYHNFGNLSQQQKQLHQAINYYQQALNMRRKKLGANHPDTISSRKRLQSLRQQTQITP